MGVDSFNRIPPQCEGRCDLSQVEVDKHGIVLSRHCSGPSFDTIDPTERVVVERGSIADIEPLQTVSRAGRVACTNSGFNLWLEELKERYTFGQSEIDLK